MKDETGLYSQAKEVFYSLAVMKDTFIQVNDEREAKIFRKHLLELVKRKQVNYRYATRLLNSKLRVIRIK